MLLPIGQEDSTVRRWPWVTFGLIAFNAFVFVVTIVTGPGTRWERQVRDKIREVGRYLGQHPYLTLPESIADLCDADCQARLAEQRRRYLEKNMAPGPSIVAEEQGKLDTLALDLRALRQKLPARRYGFTPARPRLDQAISSMFVHGGWMHFLGNMLFLFVSGPFVEDAFGRVLYGILYGLSHFAALGLHAGQFSESTVPLIGASGAIAGVMGAFLVRFARRRIQMLFMPLFPFPRPRFTFALPAFVILPLWFGEQFWYASQSEESGIAFWAHVGGFLFGAVFAFAIRAARVEEKYIHPAIEKGLTLEQHPGLEQALDARLRGDFDTGRRQIKAVLAKDPANLDAWRESYEIARAAGDAGEAGRSAGRLVEMYARQHERDLMVQLFHEASGEGFPLPPRAFLQVGSVLEKKGEWDLALDTYHRLIGSYPADAGVVRARLRRGEILRQMGETESARQELLQVRAHPSCTVDMAHAAEQALQVLVGEPVDPTALPATKLAARHAPPVLPRPR